MKRHLAALTALALLWMGCSEQAISVPLRSLERSGDVSLLCATPEGEGRPFDECPSADGGDRRLLAMVTQTKRGEVAVIDLSAGRVVDVDPTTPGFSFLPTGAEPRDIVSTPGGVATFVGVAEVGREGIYALPTSCAFPPAHDLTAFPACALPVAPGAMVVLVDPPDDAGLLRETCASPRTAAAGAPGAAAAASGRACPADLALETTPPGRRKLAVALPALGELVILDAQTVLDAAPGSFAPCVPEVVLPLVAGLPATPEAQVLPADLQPAASCTTPVGGRSAAVAAYGSQPSDLSLSGNTLYVADLAAPAVHVLDVTDPCAPRVEPPLLPASYDDDEAVVTTTAVAAGPLGTDGSRAVYAVDASDGSVMVFEVGAGATSRTPVVRPGSVDLPFEPPDRIAYTSRVQDLELLVRDVPLEDPTTGVGSIGERCDPDPSLPADSIGARFRTASDYGSGAGPRQLRGVFGFLALGGGQLAVVDIEDFDAPCRRPARTHDSLLPDFRGCADQGLPAWFTDDGSADGRPTVSDEVSCRVVQRHRSRAGSFAVNASSVGARAPSVRSFPRLTDEEGNFLTISPEVAEGPTRPRLQAVAFAPVDGRAQPLEVWIGGTRYGDAADAEPLPEHEHALAVRWVEPRSFAPVEDFSLGYEVPFTRERTSGIVRADGSFPDAVGFCGIGVQDTALARAEGERLGVDTAALDAFADRHADYVQLTGDLPPASDDYWRLGAGATCTGAVNDGHATCTDLFGNAEEPTTARDLRIVEAWNGELRVEPRNLGDAPAVTQAMVACCFPARVAYTVRAGDQWVLLGSESGLRHDIERAPDDRCVRSCDPRRARSRARAFEVRAPAPQEVLPDDGACTQVVAGPLSPESACVFEGVGVRFAVHRGALPTRRDMRIGFTLTGGYVPLTIPLSASSSVVPQRLAYIPQVGQLVVVDGASAGLSLVSLRSVAVSTLFF